MDGLKLALRVFGLCLQILHFLSKVVTLVFRKLKAPAEQAAPPLPAQRAPHPQGYLKGVRDSFHAYYANPVEFGSRPGEMNEEARLYQLNYYKPWIIFEYADSRAGTLGYRDAQMALKDGKVYQGEPFKIFAEHDARFHPLKPHHFADAASDKPPEWKLAPQVPEGHAWEHPDITPGTPSVDMPEHEDGAIWSAEPGKVKPVEPPGDDDTDPNARPKP